MKIYYRKEIIHSSKKNKDFYIVRLVLIKDENVIVAMSPPLLWLTKEDYDSLNI